MGRCWTGLLACVIGVTLGAAAEATFRSGHGGSGGRPPGGGNGRTGSGSNATSGQDHGGRHHLGGGQGSTGATGGNSHAGRSGRAAGPGPRLSGKDRSLLRTMVQNKGAGFTAAQRGAVNSLLSGFSLTPDERATLTGMLQDNSLTQDEREAIRNGLMEDATADREETVTGSAREPQHAQRYFSFQNSTRERLTVSVLCRTQNPEGDWTWFPADPSRPRKVLTLRLDPGQEARLRYEGNLVAASRVRLWAVSDGGKRWEEFKDRDLWLVPETAGNGEHLYAAPRMQTAFLQLYPPDDSGEFQQVLARR